MNDSRPVDEWVTVRLIINLLWRAKWIVAGVVAVTIAASVFYSVNLPNRYKATATLAPNESSGAGALAGLATQYQGLAGLAGIDLGAGKDDDTSVRLAILQSRKFITDFIERRELLVPLMAAKSWDPESRSLLIDESVFDPENGVWVRNVSFPKQPKPSLLEAYRYFEESVFSLTRDTKSGLISVSIEHISPDIAKQWVDWLVADINTIIMTKEINEAESAIEYLRDQVDSTQSVDLQSVFYRLIEDRIKTIVLSKITDEYFLRTIDPAAVPEIKSGPARSLIVLLSAMFAFMFAALIVIAVSIGRR